MTLFLILRFFVTAQWLGRWVQFMNVHDQSVFLQIAAHELQSNIFFSMMHDKTAVKFLPFLYVLGTPYFWNRTNVKIESESSQYCEWKELHIIVLFGMNSEAENSTGEARRGHGRCFEKLMTLFQTESRQWLPFILRSLEIKSVSLGRRLAGAAMIILASVATRSVSVRARLCS